MAASLPARFLSKKNRCDATPPVSGALAGSAGLGLHSGGTDDLATSDSKTMAVHAICRRPREFSRPGPRANSGQDADDSLLILRQRVSFRRGAGGIFRNPLKCDAVAERVANSGG